MYGLPCREVGRHQDAPKGLNYPTLTKLVRGCSEGGADS